MFEVIKGEYGKELEMFEFDYLGEHKALVMVIINAKIKFYEKGLQISTGLSSDTLFIDWNYIKGISCTRNRKALINLITDKGIIKLKKEKEETNLKQFKKILKSILPKIKIEYVKSTPSNVISLEMKRTEKLYEEQEQRVNNLLNNCGSKSSRKAENTWNNYLKENLQFPFEAEIIDDPYPLNVGDILKVTAIEGFFDLYGIIVKARMGRKQYSFPLCLLELIDKDSKNYELVDDYNFWFCNR